MRIPIQPQTYRCSFPDFDAEGDEECLVEATSAEEAAEQAAAHWERDIEDFRVLRGEETLRIAVICLQDGSQALLDILGEQGRYISKALPAEGSR